MSAPDITPDDLQEVVVTIQSGSLGLGSRADEFERRCAEIAGVQFGVAVSSGTAGLHLIVRGLGLGPADRVLVPSFTFAASVNALIYEGATPVFVDIEHDTFNVDPAALDASAGDASGVMAVDVLGHPADWAAIEAIAATNGLPIVDDSCEAIGAPTLKGRPPAPLGGPAASPSTRTSRSPPARAA